MLHCCCVAAGEYVAVEHIESVLGKCDMVEQVWVYGSSYESVLVAVVVPKKPALLSWAKEQVRGVHARHKLKSKL
jgi:long-chain acyl-CoA synthetase